MDRTKETVDIAWVITSFHVDFHFTIVSCLSYLVLPSFLTNFFRLKCSKTDLFSVF